MESLTWEIVRLVSVVRSQCVQGVAQCPLGTVELTPDHS